MVPRVSVLILTALTVLASTGAVAQGMRLPPRALGSALSSLRAEASVQRQADFIVAVVNSEPITNNELRLRLARTESQLSQRGAALPAPGELARQVLERLISEKAQLQLAEENGIRVDELAVDQAEATVARNNQIDVAELRRRIGADGLSLASFRQELRSQLILQRLREREVDGRVRISDQEVDQYLLDLQSNADPSQQDINIAQILVAIPDNASDAQVKALEARARRAFERAKSGEDFAALVKEFSDAQDRGKGGQLGLRNADRYPPLFVQAIVNLPVGAVAGPLRSDAGFHVLKLIEKTPSNGLAARVTQSHARHILLRATTQIAEEAARVRLSDYRRRVQAGQADFAALAKEHSQDASGRDGGDLGWANPGQFVPEFEDVLNTLEPGEISPPMVSRFGVHIIQLLERREQTLSAREQREQVRNLLRDKKLDEAFEAWTQEIRGRAYVEYREPPQ